MLLQPVMSCRRLSSNLPPMFRNYLKLAFRNLSRQKVFSAINITGLAVGLASSLTILLWVEDELSYDKFNSKADRTYRIIAARG